MSAARFGRIWQGFLIGLASPLTWLNYYRILYTIRLRYWRAKRKYGRGA